MKTPIVRRNENPNTFPPKEKNAYFTLMATFKAIATANEWEPMMVNAFVMGMCRTSMWDLVGKEEAEKLDAEWRHAVGWE